MKEKQPKPLIGILTIRKNNGTIAGNGQLFRNLQKKLISLGGISFVFTPEGIHEDFIDGFLFSPEKNGWMNKSFPYPKVVYNRIPFRPAEQQENIQSFFSNLTKKGIPYFNPCFIDKYELFKAFKTHPTIKQFLPETILIKEKKDLLKLLKNRSSIYLKPANSARGKGIFRLKQDPSFAVHVEGRKEQERYETFDHFWKEWHQLLLGETYLAQEDIHPAKYKGSRFDFRILAHAAGGDYTLTGIGIRQSQEQEVTTHIPSGGKLLPYELLQSKAHDQFIQSIISPIGKGLSERFGYFGEFSIDAGVSQTGNYYIYEVNSKPMSFDEPEIEARKIDHLCRLFLELAKPNPGVNALSCF